MKGAFIYIKKNISKSSQNKAKQSSGQNTEKESCLLNIYIYM